MAREPDYEKLYKTYQRRRSKMYFSGKRMKEQLSFEMFSVTYEAMKEEYKELGYKTPTKNIIQNLVRKDIDYDFSLNQARELRNYLEKYYEEGLAEDVEAFKEQIKQAKSREERRQIKQAFLEEHQGANISNITEKKDGEIKVKFNFKIEQIRFNIGELDIKDVIKTYNNELKARGITNSYDRKKLITQYFFGGSE